MPSAAEDQDRCREASHQQHDVGISRKAGEARILSTCEPDLIYDELFHEPPPMLPYLKAEPRQYDGREYARPDQIITECQPASAPVYDDITCIGEHEQQQRYGSLGQYGQTDEDGRPCQWTDSQTVGIRLPEKISQESDPKEGEEIEPWINDPALEIKMRKEATGIEQAPPDAKTFSVQSPADQKQAEQREYATYCVGNAGGEFIDAEDLHRHHLHPEKHGRFLPERFKIDLHPHVVTGDDHLPGGLRKIDLIPVEQIDGPQRMEKQERRNQDDDDRNSVSHTQMQR